MRKEVLTMTIRINNRDELQKILLFICKNFKCNYNPFEFLVEISSQISAMLPFGEVSEVQIEYLETFAEITFTIKDLRTSFFPPRTRKIKYQFDFEI